MNLAKLLTSFFMTGSLFASPIPNSSGMFDDLRIKYCKEDNTNINISLNGREKISDLLFADNYKTIKFSSEDKHLLIKLACKESWPIINFYEHIAPFDGNGLILKIANSTNSHWTLELYENIAPFDINRLILKQACIQNSSTCLANYDKFKLYDVNGLLLNLAINNIKKINEDWRIIKNYENFASNENLIYLMDAVKKDSGFAIKHYKSIFKYDENGIMFEESLRAEPSIFISNYDINHIFDTKRIFLNLASGLDSYSTIINYDIIKPFDTNKLLWNRALNNLESQNNNLEDVLEKSMKCNHIMNVLHNEKDDIRFRIIEHASSQKLYDLIVHGKEELYTSTYLGIINRLLDRTDDVYDLAKSNSFRDFEFFIQIACEYNKIKDVLNKTSNTVELLKEFVNTVDELSGLIAFAETLTVIEDKKSKIYLENSLKKLLSQNSRVFGVVVGQINEHLMDPYFNTFLDKNPEYKQKSNNTINKSNLFNDNINTQLHFFYDDKDGKITFDTFSYNLKRNKWNIINNEKYIIASKKNIAGDKSIEIYANKPKHSDVMLSLNNKLKNKTSVYVHRGHSYYLNRTMNFIQNNASIVFLGSCGGYRRIIDIIEKSPDAYVLSTKQKGTLVINEPLLKNVFDEILNEKRVFEWDAVWNNTNIHLSESQKEQFLSYRNPKHNLMSHLYLELIDLIN